MSQDGCCLLNLGGPSSSNFVLFINDPVPTVLFQTLSGGVDNLGVSIGVSRLFGLLPIIGDLTFILNFFSADDTVQTETISLPITNLAFQTRIFVGQNITTITANVTSTNPIDNNAVGAITFNTFVVSLNSCN